MQEIGKFEALLLQTVPKFVTSTLSYFKHFK